MKMVEQFKRRILDLAIRGKLVPQDPNDESASVLLERIREERAELVKAGKIKKDKQPSRIVIGSDGAAYEKFADGSIKDVSNELPFALPNGWAWTRIGNVCYDFQYGTARKSTKNGNVPVLRMGNLRAGEIDYSDLVYTSDKDDIERYCLNPGDLLFNRTNSSEKVGKVSIFRGKKPCIYAGYLVRFRPVRSDSEFINYMMNSRYQWEFCQSVKTDAVNQSNISASKFIQFLVPLPPLAEQKRIVAKIKELFMVADLLDATTNNLMNTSKQIDKKILDLAIRGKLVPQDPNEEPASELVKRIATSHKSPYENWLTCASAAPTRARRPGSAARVSREWPGRESSCPAAGPHFQALPPPYPAPRPRQTVPRSWRQSASVRREAGEELMFFVDDSMQLFSVQSP